LRAFPWSPGGDSGLTRPGAERCRWGAKLYLFAGDIMMIFYRLDLQQTEPFAHYRIFIPHSGC
jgi:hypothetical protein